MTNKEKELIKDNLRAYNANFKYIKIVSADYGDGFYVSQAKNVLNQAVGLNIVIILIT